MASASERAFFGLDARLRDEHRRLLAVLLLAAAVIAMVPIAELLGLSAWADLTAAAVAMVALAVAARVIVLLRRSESRRRRAVEETVDLMGATVLVLDDRSRILLANPAACATFGLAEPELLGVEIQRLFSPADRDASLRAFRAILDGSVDPRGHRSTREVVRPDGSSRFVSWHVAPRFDADGRVESLLISGQDVTTAHRQARELARDRADIDVLHALASEVAGRDDARQPVVERVAELIGADVVALAEPRAGSSGGWEITSSTYEALGGRILEEDGAVGHRAVGDEPTFVQRDDGSTEAALAAAAGVGSLCLQPVPLPDRVGAWLLCGWAEPVERLDLRQEQLLRLAASETASALRRVATLAHLEAAALTDPLTGLANRRAFDHELERSLAQARRPGVPLALLVLDLNAFKALNDQEGHTVGDARLVACAKAWGSVLRAGDLLARLGGDEFAVVAHHATRAEAEALAQRLRDVTPHPAGAAVGVAAWTDEDAETLYRAADGALYADKAQASLQRLVAPERLAAVLRTGLWGAASDAQLDALVAEASQVLRAAVYVTLVGVDELVYVGKPDGEPLAGRPLTEAHCQLVVTSGRRVAISGHAGDAPGRPSSYAGAPVVDGTGQVLGALCACSDEHREWTGEDLDTIERFAGRASRRLDARPRVRPRSSAGSTIEEVLG